MVALRVIAELAPDPLGTQGTYCLDLLRALVATAPAGCSVEAVVARHPTAVAEQLHRTIPGLSGVTSLPVPRNELLRAWRYGMPIRAGHGLIHSPTQLAPLFKHDRRSRGDQVVVTIHDANPWTKPELAGTDHSWRTAMAKRAFKHADAIVVPSHAVADELAHAFEPTARLRVIADAARTSVVLPGNAQERAEAMGLPAQFVAAIGPMAPHRGLQELISAMLLPAVGSLPLLVAGPDAYDGRSVSVTAMEAGLPEGRVRALGTLAGSDLAVVLDRATVVALPSITEGFGFGLLESFALGTPVVHSDAPALLETAAGAGYVVPRAGSREGYSAGLAEAIGRVAQDSALADQLVLKGRDRARAFSWQASAEQLWRLHAEL